MRAPAVVPVSDLIGTNRETPSVFVALRPIDDGPAELRLIDHSRVDREAGLVVPYCGKFTVTVLEQFWVPASHTLYMKLAWPVVPVESSYKPSFGVVAITTPVR